MQCQIRQTAIEPWVEIDLLTIVTEHMWWEPMIVTTRKEADLIKGLGLTIGNNVLVYVEDVDEFKHPTAPSFVKVIFP